jgi:hypothetical protein
MVWCVDGGNKGRVIPGRQVGRAAGMNMCGGCMACVGRVCSSLCPVWQRTAWGWHFETGNGTAPCKFLNRREGKGPQLRDVLGCYNKRCPPVANSSLQSRSACTVQHVAEERMVVGRWCQQASSACASVSDTMHKMVPRYPALNCVSPITMLLAAHDGLVLTYRFRRSAVHPAGRLIMVLYLLSNSADSS